MPFPDKTDHAPGELAATAPVRLGPHSQTGYGNVHYRKHFPDPGTPWIS